MRRVHAFGAWKGAMGAFGHEKCAFFAADRKVMFFVMRGSTLGAGQNVTVTSGNQRNRGKKSGGFGGLRPRLQVSSSKS